MNKILALAAVSGLLITGCGSTSHSSNSTSILPTVSSGSSSTTFIDTTSTSSIRSSGGSSGAKTGSSSGITVPVSDDASYDAAANTASAHCNQWGLTPGAPTLTNGGSALAYSCQ